MNFTVNENLFWVLASILLIVVITQGILLVYYKKKVKSVMGLVNKHMPTIKRLEKSKTEDEMMDMDRFFGLSYASYLVIPRTVLQSAPLVLQDKIIGNIRELEVMFGDWDEGGFYTVRKKDSRGRFVKDKFRDYQKGTRKLPILRDKEKIRYSYDE